MVALILGAPSAFLFAGISLFSLAKKGIISEAWALGIFLAIIGQFFVVMFLYGKKGP